MIKISKLNGYKTYLLAFIAIAGAAVGYIDGELSIIDAIEIVFGALGLSTVRHAIGKK